MKAAARAYGARTVKRERRTQAEVQALDDAIVTAAEAAQPCSVRHVFYLMTDPTRDVHVEKSQKGYRDVQHRLVELRRAGRVPYGWVVDTTRVCYSTATFTSAGEFLRSAAQAYRADLWSLAGTYCEVWCESRSLASVLAGICGDLAVRLYPAGGFSSLSFAYESAEHIKVAHDGRPVVVLYIGDYDPAGVLIDRKILDEMRRHLGADFDLRFERLGITPQQIATMNLPTKPRKEGDRRALHIERTVEAEAMPPNAMRALLRGSVEALLPEHALEVTRAAEESERAFIWSLANMRRRRPS